MAHYASANRVHPETTMGKLIMGSGEDRVEVTVPLIGLRHLEAFGIVHNCPVCYGESGVAAFHVTHAFKTLDVVLMLRNRYALKQEPVSDHANYTCPF